MKTKIINRRSFIKKGLYTFASVSAFGMLRSGISYAGLLSTPDNGTVPIIGAGLAGLSIAYQLKKMKIPFVLFEGSARIGGRVSSKFNLPSNQGLIELGGEFIDSTHAELISLAKELNVALEEVKFSPSFHIKGKKYSFIEFTNAVEPLSKKIETESSAHLEKISIRDFLHSVHGIEEWARQAIQTAHTSEYGIDSGQLPASLLMKAIGKPLLYLGKTDRQFRIQGGSKALIDALMKAIFDDENVADQLHLEHKLVKIAKDKNALQLSFINQQRVIDLSCQRMICTIPLPCLRQVTGAEQMNSYATMQKTEYGTSSKLAISFSKRFWDENEFANCFTDRQIQFIMEASGEHSKNSATLTIQTGASSGKNFSSSSLNSIFSDLDYIYVEKSKALNNKVSIMNWYNNPFSLGSQFCPSIRSSKKLDANMSESEFNSRVFFAGEHMSLKNFGTMNGAIESATNAVQLFMKNKGGA